jgi:hypothetical protein
LFDKLTNAKGALKLFCEVADFFEEIDSLIHRLIGSLIK